MQLGDEMGGFAICRRVKADPNSQERLYQRGGRRILLLCLVKNEIELGVELIAHCWFFAWLIA